MKFFDQIMQARIGQPQPSANTAEAAAASSSHCFYADSHSASFARFGSEEPAVAFWRRRLALAQGSAAAGGIRLPVPLDE